jgi:hypothetical protein
MILYAIILTILATSAAIWAFIKYEKLIKTKKEHAEYVYKKNKELAEIQKQIKNKIANLNEKEKGISKIIQEITQAFPFVAGVVADFEFHRAESEQRYLLYKNHPAKKAAEIVSEVKKNLRQAIKDKKQLEYKIKYYEHLFPWLIDYFDTPIENEFINKILQNKNRIANDNYNGLSKSEKYQLQLDRYWMRQKSNWEVGRDYERYVGYRYEVDGWKVNYWGAIKGFEDMGRDLIAKKKEMIEIIQCKRWAKTKLIHEKHIFQLFGTAIQYAIEHGHDIENWDQYTDIVASGIITPVFITSTNLSPIASGVAEALGIKVLDRYEMDINYPCIKCHAKTASGDMIYHLPFDQQYDKIKMDFDAGDRYLRTISEVESAGFRRAKRWMGDKGYT